MSISINIANVFIRIYIYPNETQAKSSAQFIQLEVTPVLYKLSIFLYNKKIAVCWIGKLILLRIKYTGFI